MSKSTPVRTRGPRFPVLCILATCVVLAAGCTIEEPQLPSFTTMATIPIGGHEITVTELIEDEDFLTEGENSAVMFAIEGEATTVSLDFDLSADLDGASFSAELGDFTIAAPPAMDFGFRLDELYPDAASLPPVPLPVPAFDFTLDSSPADIDGIESATLATGTLSVEVFNGLPVTVSGDAPPEQLTVEVIDPRYGSVITTLTADGGLAPGETGLWSVDLAGVELPGEVSVRLQGGSPGSSTPVTVDPASSLAVAVALTDLTVVEAVATIGALSIQAGAVEALPDSLGIIAAEISAGALDITIENGLPLACRAELSCDDMFDAAGSPLLVVMDLAPHQRTTTGIDLAGAGITGPDDTPLTELAWNVSMTTPGSAGTPVTLRAQDRILVDVSPTTLVLGEVTGVFPEQSFDLDMMVEQIDIPDELDGITLTQASLTVEILNDTGIEGALDVRLEGTNSDGLTAVLQTTADIESRKGTEPERTVIRLDETNSNITEFLELMPENFEMTGAIVVGGVDSPGTVRPGDTAAISWRIDAPLRVIIDNSEIHRDAEPLDLDEDLREELDDHIFGGRILTVVENRFPFAAQVLFQVGSDSLSAMDSPGLVIGPLAVAAATIDPVTGYAKDSAESRHDIQLTREEIRVMTQPNAYTAVVALIPGTAGAEVELRTDDYMQLSGALVAEVLVEEED